MCEFTLNIARRNSYNDDMTYTDENCGLFMSYALAKAAAELIVPNRNVLRVAVVNKTTGEVVKEFS